MLLDVEEIEDRQDNIRKQENPVVNIKKELNEHKDQSMTLWSMWQYHVRVLN
jgi:hypothetical protein